MLALPASSNPVAPTEENSSLTTKKKRRPAGTPDPDAEVISLSPKTLLESDRYICQICNQGFRREQNLQMHLRRHKVPWKLLKKEKSSVPNMVRKRVYVCPEQSCLHHDPAHALGDLVGIKKHFRRKHGGWRQWICLKCSKGYAVQSDYKAHVKTCGTRGHSCNCGRVFSRVESFIEHQDTCRAVKPPLRILELSLSSSSSSFSFSSQQSPVNIITKLCLSLNPIMNTDKYDNQFQIQILLEEKRNADEERESARKDVEEAERELLDARKMREWAQRELRNAMMFRETTVKMLLQITCDACRRTNRMATRVITEI